MRPVAGCIKQIGYDNFFLIPITRQSGNRLIVPVSSIPTAHIIIDTAVFHAIEPIDQQIDKKPDNETQMRNKQQQEDQDPPTEILVSYQILFNSNGTENTMEMTDGLELPAKKVEYLKYLFGRNTAVKTNDLASRFGVDPSTITKTINELAESGYITHTPYHGVRLSEDGKRYAEFCIKRHRILALMLAHYGLSDERACSEVSRFEGLVSRYAVDRICHAMGHPRQGICGKIAHDALCPECEVQDA